MPSNHFLLKNFSVLVSSPFPCLYMTQIESKINLFLVWHSVIDIKLADKCAATHTQQFLSMQFDILKLRGASTAIVITQTSPENLKVILLFIDHHPLWTQCLDVKKKLILLYTLFSVNISNFMT